MSILIEPRSRPGLYRHIFGDHNLMYILDNRFYNPYNLTFIGHRSPGEWIPLSFNVNISGSFIFEIVFANTFMFYQQLPNGRFIELLNRYEDPSFVEDINILEIPVPGGPEIDGRLTELPLQPISAQFLNSLMRQLWSREANDYDQILELMNDSSEDSTWRRLHIIPFNEEPESPSIEESESPSIEVPDHIESYMSLLKQLYGLEA